MEPLHHIIAWSLNDGARRERIMVIDNYMVTGTQHFADGPFHYGIYVNSTGVRARKRAIKQTEHVEKMGFVLDLLPHHWAFYERDEGLGPWLNLQGPEEFGHLFNNTIKGDEVTLRVGP